MSARPRLVMSQRSKAAVPWVRRVVRWGTRVTRVCRRVVSRERSSVTVEEGWVESVSLRAEMAARRGVCAVR